MDLFCLQCVRSAAWKFLAKTADKPANVLICNAGVMAIPAPGSTTADGFETQFGTNHLAHFLLFNLLKPSLLASSTPEFNSRVVTLSSVGHRFGGIRFDDYSFKKGDYTPFGAYAQSKTANIYMASYIDRHFGPEGIHATSLNPGGIWTPLQRYVPQDQVHWKENAGIKDFMKSTEQGAATTVWAAVAKEWEGEGGKYLKDVQVGKPVKEGQTALGDPGYAPHAYDEEEDRLWAESLKMIGLV